MLLLPMRGGNLWGRRIEYATIREASGLLDDLQILSTANHFHFVID